MASVPSISLHAPFGLFIALGLKPIETRNHARFRGLVDHRIAIHQAMKWDDGARAMVDEAEAMVADTPAHDPWVFQRARQLIEQHEAGERRMPQGCFLCTARVTSHIVLGREHSGRALCPAEGKYGLFLHGIEQLREPIRGPGRQGIWRADFPDDPRYKVQLGDMVEIHDHAHSLHGERGQVVDQELIIWGGKGPRHEFHAVKFEDKSLKEFGEHQLQRITDGN